MSIARRESRPIKTLGVKLHNRRVEGGLMHDGSIVWQFKQLKNKSIYVKRIRLSRGVVLVMISILNEFAKEGARS